MTLAPDLRAADYLDAAQALLPRGAVWPREPEAVQTRFWAAMATRLADWHARARGLSEAESDPASATEALPDWERAFGLPDACTPANVDMIARRSALLAKIAAKGGQSRAYFIEVAAALGFAVTIEEFRPFRVGVGAVGDNLYSSDWLFTWRVHAPAISDTVTSFTVGISAVGDPLRAWGTTTLECVFARLKPARTNVLFSYGS